MTNILSPTVPLPAGFASLGEQVRERLGDSLVALLLFGSCLSAQTRQPGSVPDLLAFVDDLEAALKKLGSGPITRALASWLPPLTLALRDQTPGGSARPLAKLNLVALTVAHEAVHELPDLYLTGRLSKPTAWLWYRDPECRTAVEALLTAAATTLADLTLRALDGQEGPIDLRTAVLFYIGQSYLAELRPEGPEKWHALHAGFPDFYDQRVRSLLLTRAPPLGLRPPTTALPGQNAPNCAPSPSLSRKRARSRAALLQPTSEPTVLIDERTQQQRRADHQTHTQLLRRSQLRTIARWPKMALVYRGWLPYLRDKLQRVWRQRQSPTPANPLAGGSGGGPSTSP